MFNDVRMPRPRHVSSQNEKKEASNIIHVTKTTWCDVTWVEHRARGMSDARPGLRRHGETHMRSLMRFTAVNHEHIDYGL